MRPIHTDHARRGSLIVMATTSKNSRTATNWIGEILIVDDEPDICAAVQDLLQDEGYTTRMASDTDSALAALAERMPSLVLLDIWLRNGEREGIDLLETIGTRF
ncbi:MAG: response regulator, partial [Rhodospirillales bacterium]|nr:response regulator [Rhodospirillales bacterium]